ncbi:hypothetical protein A2Z63_00210 [Candidatus Giovannonibacteria bacterium RIFCSPLOWO2_02_44_8]|uniref:Uncharacterized protein n=3 Tax=Candidatus Giovannoniibacteriota TaxID=1752738 RepID=A0A1F5XDU1_9BACT|nr:MAG: hypothetical protein A2W57_01805 [Candidatus Giovannonibacteria bacterium RIFCSPHIGHO2_02_43_16]OGF86009.1 MAG: hypothetical protein A2Z63_00210 [Candidatus Giovannonibacteria bacterium RIFCSPLOWO2_02_44_8]OGF95710.1 MAG: hypothetical protein A2Y47_01210 [Candidatus Giovannonibacteria bacterium RIFCSPLOWO2_12_43_8]
MTWDYTETEYKKQEKDKKWKLERLINYGLKGKRLDRDLLEKHLKDIRIPENRRTFLELLLWEKRF